MTSCDEVMVVGQGLIGAALRDRLHQAGHPVLAVCRTPPKQAVGDHLSLDVSSADGRRELADTIRLRRPRSIVLVHGPSDVTWCDTHAEDAAVIHGGVASAVSSLRVPVVLISTDNVFTGDRRPSRVGDPVTPSNAYGMAKLLAERALLAEPGHVVARVSLVYGWTPGRYRRNFAERCLASAAQREQLEVPEDQYFTPIHVANVAEAIAAVATNTGTAPRVLHLAGPDLLSRAEFARAAYLVVGAPPALVRAVPRAETTWASRPPVSALHPTDLSGVKGLRVFAAWPVTVGLAQMWTRRP